MRYEASTVMPALSASRECPAITSATSGSVEFAGIAS